MRMHLESGILMGLEWILREQEAILKRGIKRVNSTREKSRQLPMLRSECTEMCIQKGEGGSTLNTFETERRDWVKECDMGASWRIDNAVNLIKKLL